MLVEVNHYTLEGSQALGIYLGMFHDSCVKLFLWGHFLYFFSRKEFFSSVNEMLILY